MATSDRTEQQAKALFPRLRGGRRGLPRAQVARHQKARLEGAMVEAVARHGYAGTTLRELVTLAGVSKTTFYEHFDSKQDCFLQTFDEIVAILAVQVAEAFGTGTDFRGRLLAALGAFMDLAVAEPDAATLTAVESLTLGAAGVAHRERASEGFEALVQQSFDHSPSPVAVPASTVRAIVAGIRGVAYRRLRAGEAAELPGLTEELVDWALGYQQPDSEAVVAAMEAAKVPLSVELPRTEADAEKPSWEEPPDSPRSKETLTQRERIVRAAARVVVDRGYEALSIPAISAAAGTSNQTFYEHFENKREAFLAAFEIIATEALATAVAAFGATSGPAAIGSGLRALCEYVAGHATFARLAFFELPTAGPAALDRADQILDAFTAFLSPPAAPEGIGAPASILAAQAIGTGIWSAIQHEIEHGRGSELPDLAPELARIALAPLRTAPTTD
jgi:AcrR family transcriptional regulator